MANIRFVRMACHSRLCYVRNQASRVWFLDVQKDEMGMADISSSENMSVSCIKLVNVLKDFDKTIYVIGIAKVCTID